MTKDEIYEHLAKVYLGKKKKKKKRKSLKLFTLLLINIIALPLIVALIIGGVNSRSGRVREKASNSVLLALNYYPLRINYDFKEGMPQVQAFNFGLPKLEITKLSRLEFSLKGTKQNYPQVLKITLENKRKEKSSYYLTNISRNWQRFSIPLSEFKEITDLSSLTQISFIIESWNLNNSKGTFLIDDLAFSSEKPIREVN